MALRQRLLLKWAVVVVLLLLASAGLGLKYISGHYGVHVAAWLEQPESRGFTLGSLYPSLPVSLEPFASGFSSVTDMEFLPGSDERFLVLQKSGEVILADADPETEHRVVISLDVHDRSEQGLLGIALHPEFPDVPCMYLNYVPDEKHNGLYSSRVAEWCTKVGAVEGDWRETRILFELAQPWNNHNAGALVFDREGNLFIPWGDGGSGHDPQGNGQDRDTWLGSILRIRPAAPGSDEPYSIPEDNPFTDDPDVPDELFAWGFRNPWRASLDPAGRLVVADVGQNLWEELDIVIAGGNYGWNILEGTHCLETPCDGDGMVPPVFEYSHRLENGEPQGFSITGGYVYTSDDYPLLHGKYVFGDYVTGQLWAAELPREHDGRAVVWTLGQWPMMPATFGRDHNGRVYVADFARGEIFRLVTPAGDGRHDPS